MRNIILRNIECNFYKISFPKSKFFILENRAYFKDFKLKGNPCNFKVLVFDFESCENFQI